MQRALKSLFLEHLYLKCSLPTVLIDQQRRILASNASFEQLLQSPAGAVVGRELLDLITPEGHDELEAALANATDGSTGLCNLLALRAATVEVPVSLSAIAVTESAQTLGYCLTLTDLSARKKEERLQRWFVHEVIRAQEEERQRVARELHDQIGQAVAVLIVRLMALLDLVQDREARSRLSELLVLATDAVEEVRRIARGLRPAALDDGGLRAAVEAQAADFETSHGIQVDLHIPGLDDCEEFGDDLKIAVYRIIQEALTNVSRHANATRVSIVAERRGALLKLLVEDDGSGFKSPPRPAARPSLGLVGVRERIALLRGSMTIESHPGKGSTMYFEIPLEVSGWA